MCHESDSAPAVYGQAITEAKAASLPLPSADGTLVGAYLAVPRERASGIGVVILPDMRGLHAFYERLAERLAEQGHAAIAIDYFARTAGIGPRGDDFPVVEHITRVRRDAIDADIEAAVARLRAPDGGGCRAVFAMGFCFGGRQAFFASRPRFGFEGVIGFYGGTGLYPNGAVGPTQRAAELGAPILGLFGGADEGIPGDEVAAFGTALTEAGVAHELVTYPGAPHGFFDVRQADHAAASADAWRRTLRFVGGEALTTA